MNILFVTAQFCEPPNTGDKLIILNRIKQLAARHTIDLTSFRRATDRPSQELAHYCRHITLIDEAPRPRVLGQMLLGVLLDLPLAVSHYWSPRTGERIRAQIAAENYDAVIFEKTDMMQFLPEAYPGARLVSFVDPTALVYGRSAYPYRSWTEGLWKRYEAGRIRRYEAKQIARFDRLVMLNQKDAHDYARLYPHARVDWSPYGIDTRDYNVDARIERERGMVLISGKLSHPPNADAVEHFYRAIFPRVCGQFPGARLYLVGADPPEHIRQFAHDPRVLVTGTVPDMKMYLQRAQVSVCAVRLKFGTQTKVLEAMACGTPVVTTSAGNHGIGANSGEALFETDDPDLFADYVVSLLRGEHWDQMSRAARQFVVENFTWEKSVSRLENIIQGVRNGRTGNA